MRGPLYPGAKCSYLLLEPELGVSLFGVVLVLGLVGDLLVLELEPMLPEVLPAPWLALPAPDVPPEALLE